MVMFDVSGACVALTTRHQYVRDFDTGFESVQDANRETSSFGNPRCRKGCSASVSLRVAR